VAVTSVGNEAVLSAAASSSAQFCDKGCPDDTGWVILIASFLLCAVLLAFRLHRLILALDGAAVRNRAWAYAVVCILTVFDGDLIVWLPWRVTPTTRAFAGFPDETAIAFTVWGIILRKAPFLLFTVTTAPSSPPSLIFCVTVAFSGLSLALSLAALGMRYLGKSLEGAGDVVLGRAMDFTPGEGAASTDSDASSLAGYSFKDLNFPLLEAQQDGGGGRGVQGGIGGGGGGGGGGNAAGSRSNGGALAGGGGTGDGGGGSGRKPFVATWGGSSYGVTTAITAQVLLGGGLAVLVATKKVPSSQQVREVAEPLLITVAGLFAVTILFFSGRFAWATCFGRKFERLSTIHAKNETLEKQRQELEEQRQELEANELFVDVVREVTLGFGIDIDTLRSFEEIEAMYVKASLRYFGDEAAGVAPDMSTEAEAELLLRERLFNAHPERAQQEAARSAAWRDEHLPRCRAAQMMMRTVVPPGARGVTVESLTGQGLPLPVARRIARNPALWLIGTHPDDIARMAIPDLRKGTTQGLDVVELRAVFAALPSQMANDDSKGSKAAWLKEVQATLQKLTELEVGGKLPPTLKRHRCYEGLVEGQGPLDPNSPLEKDEVIISSAYEPTAIEDLEDGSGGGGGTASGRVAAARAALLKAKKDDGNSEASRKRGVTKNPAAKSGELNRKLSALRAGQHDHGQAEEAKGAGAQLFASLKTAVTSKNQTATRTAIGGDSGGGSGQEFDGAKAMAEGLTSGLTGEGLRTPPPPRTEMIKTITVDAGPVGIQLTNDARGYAAVMAAAGQAAEKGVEQGDLIFSIGGKRLIRGTSQGAISDMIRGLSRPFAMCFLPEGTADPEAIFLPPFGI
jgi:hypothetical protein